jgi:uncharacterized protein (DUF362 family)
MDAMRRREFIGRTVAAGVAVAALGRGRLPAEEPQPKSVVVKAVRGDATTEKKIDAAVVREMVHAAVCRLAGKQKPEDAWPLYVRKDDVVGIKISSKFGVGSATHPEVAAAIVEGCRMAGVPDDNIIVWDFEDKHLSISGYTINRGPGVKYRGVNADGWEDQPTAIHTCRGRLAKILTREITALINAPVLKSHPIVGYTNCLKNHYGSFHNPPEAHGGGCDPFMACLNNLPVIRTKSRLMLSDALLPVADRGPQPAPQFVWECRTILASVDPVAIDAVALKILDEQRVRIQKPPASAKAKCLLTAAQMGLGAADMEKIDLVTA